MDLSQEKQTLLETLKLEGIDNPQVLEAIAAVPREQFVLENYIPLAYENTALPIEAEQTISQPYIVALMTQSLFDDRPLGKVLEIGTGSGYQAAVLSHVAKTVYSIERIRTLYDRAKTKLADYKNIHLLFGDGFSGWEEEAPFDGILVTAGLEEEPNNLMQQLADKGKLIAPIGPRDNQRLYCFTRIGNTFDKRVITNVRFVPMLPGLEQ